MSISILMVFSSTEWGLASAVEPPLVDRAKLPPRSTPTASEGIEPAGRCRRTTSITATERTIPAADRYLNFRAAWPLTTGAGITVAVIDTGVNPSPTVGTVRGGGDYIVGGDGLTDCDSHGTLVAAIIAGSRNDEGFSGVAPDAEILSIRQSSDRFREKRASPSAGSVSVGGGVGKLSTLAPAIRRAADEGASVINISEVACVPVRTNLADGELGAAVQYAAAEKDVVIVAAAGNIGPRCAENPRLNPPGSRHENGWDSLVSIATPAWYNKYVLAVGAIDEAGQPAKFSQPGPWVDVAAPGTNIISASVADPATAIADTIVSENGDLTPIQGTSFAAPFVAGTAALIRSRFPSLTAKQVINRIITTAHPPAGGRNFTVGYGIVDPVAAVTAAGRSPSTRGAASTHEVVAPIAATDDNEQNRTVAIAMAMILSAVVGAVVTLRVLDRRNPRR